jgi:hypothetical protein
MGSKRSRQQFPDKLQILPLLQKLTSIQSKQLILRSRSRMTSKRTPNGTYIPAEQARRPAQTAMAKPLRLRTIGINHRQGQILADLVPS